MTKYDEAIKHIYDCYGEKTEMDVQMFDVLDELNSQYEYRKGDAELLNELRKITGTMGDLDLKAKVKQLMERENQ